VGNGAAISTDGITWTASSLATAFSNWTSVTSLNNSFVAVSTRSPQVAFSSNGISWSYFTTDQPTPSSTSNRRIVISGPVTGDIPLKIASEDYVDTTIESLIDAAPEALNTLNELSAALNDDENFATTVTTALSNKSDVGHGHAISDVTNLQTSLDGKASSSHTHNQSEIVTSDSDKSSNYTLQSSDKNSHIRSTGSEITITVPDVLANGEFINFIQAGAGRITFAGSGITLNSKDSYLKTTTQFSGATVIKAGGAYYLIGDLSA
jgi:hypothetical protein